MYTDRKKGNGHAALIVLVAVLVTAAVLIAALLMGSGREEKRREGARAIRDLIERTARQCYAVEGIYPPNLAYLEDHYGIEVNKKDFYVTYEAFASNVPPSVIVTPEGSVNAEEALP